MHAKHIRPHQHVSNPMSVIISILLSSLFIPRHDAKIDADMYKNCSKKITSPCGKPIEGGLGYPFWGENIRPLDCGLQEFKLSCEDSDDLVVDIGFNNKYHVVEINLSASVLKLNYPDDPLEHICDSSYSPVPDTMSKENLYQYGENTVDLYLLYNCSGYEPPEPLITYKFTCSNDDYVYFLRNNSFLEDEKYPSYCSKTKVPVDSTALEEFIKNPLQGLFHRSFEVFYNNRINQEACTDCVNAGGLCWIGTYSNSNDTCLYQGDVVQDKSPSSNGDGKKLGLIIGIAIGGVVATILLLLAIFFFCRRRKAKQVSYVVSRNISSTSFSMSDSEKGSGTYMGVPTFSYNELEKATNNFDSNSELGDGGFGAVYKGKLLDGREVAVKRLYENSMKRVEQFMNEIEILTRLRHPNLVVLYGSTSPQCRKLLLVYEYIPNGTIADHLYGEDSERGNLTWKTRMSISIETADALSFLHASDVIHRDVKTTNILLDKNFRVKVADFGLSRLFPLDVTHVSTAPQGTPGYVDPEYHQCYQLTSKSDVYSFGVVLIELISSKPAVDITRHRHEINLANLAINKIQGDALHELVDPSLGFESDYEVRRMITEVAELAFRCLQNDRESRPSMEEVHISLKEIQSRSFGEKNASENHTFKDDASLLKNYPQNHSPDSVTYKWVSRSTNSSSSM